MIAALCHGCQRPAERSITTADGRVWCADFVECNYRVRLRLGVPLYQANQLRARDRWSYSKAQGGGGEPRELTGEGTPLSRRRAAASSIRTAGPAVELDLTL